MKARQARKILSTIRLVGPKPYTIHPKNKVRVAAITCDRRGNNRKKRLYREIAMKRYTAYRMGVDPCAGGHWGSIMMIEIEQRAMHRTMILGISGE